jgi:hypothetical protein
LLNSTPAQSDRTISSFPLQQRHQSFLGDRSRVSTSVSTKPVNPIGQLPLASTPNDLGVSSKVLDVNFHIVMLDNNNNNNLSLHLSNYLNSMFFTNLMENISR